MVKLFKVTNTVTDLPTARPMHTRDLRNQDYPPTSSGGGGGGGRGGGQVQREEDARWSPGRDRATAEASGLGGR